MPAPKDFPQMWKDVIARIVRLEQRLPFAGTPIRPQADGSVQSDDFDGDLSTDNAGTKGWALSSLKAAFGELILRPGSIGNDSLTNPIQADINGGNGAGASVSTTSTVKATTSLTVPAGFTMALVRADALGEAVNSTAASDYLYVEAAIQGTGGGEMYTVAQPGYGASAVGIANRLVTGLTGGNVITCDAVSRTNTAGWAASAGNLWIIHMQVIWLR